MKKNHFFYFLALFSFFSDQARSNDTSATIAGGQIRYQSLSGINMQKEALTITLDQIKVNYQFRNTTNKDILTTVAFPLPFAPIELFDTSRVSSDWDYTSRFGLDVSPQLLKNLPKKEWIGQNPFINFQRIVNGISKTFNAQVKAINQKKEDITQLLIENNIPISSSYLGGYLDQPPLENYPDLVKKLDKLGLISKNNLPCWQSQIIFYWSEIFPAAKTISVEHTYRPHSGAHWLQADRNISNLNDFAIIHRDINPDGSQIIKNISDYKISVEDKVKLLTHFQMPYDQKVLESSTEKNFVKIARIFEINYILTTANNWDGPIKEFDLKITPPNKNSILLHTFDTSLKRTQAGDYVTHIKNYKPRHDLKVFFVELDEIMTSPKY